ncbi:hypothetical protein HPB47_000519 [Ixodes persulcatus]|uniref:Uncharacterized protein n=1 Tax=Ixodes persulcatus TaxID=34615 RepID=A0AC60PRJ7_IXOPE|nr:hypothetical protein HPB47_000519 [Ixodes persulcatus]
MDVSGTPCGPLAVMGDPFQRGGGGGGGGGGYVSPYPNTANMSSAAFYLEALHAVVPPVILVRLLQHRFLGTMHIRRGAPSRTSIASENRSRAGSSAGNEDSLRVRRRVTLTINCSSPARAASTSAEERRDSVRPPEKQVTVVPPENVVGPSLSPEHSSPAGRRAFKFSSLKKRVSKVVATTQDQNSSSLQTTSEADIVAFQKELQNLPNFESQASVERRFFAPFAQGPSSGTRTKWPLLCSRATPT